ncbi:MAG TPA: hypothetical protein VHV10_19325 [Ktedonobacteraceae bacterium]|nr:hypothetical protein [Ktedonobacteraceae bacterium]
MPVDPIIIVSTRLSMTSTSRSLFKGSFAFTRPNFPLPGLGLRLTLSLDVNTSFTPHRYQ